MPKAPSDDHGWSSVTGAKDGGRGPWRIGGSAHPLAMDGRVSLKPRMARRDLVRCPVSGVGRLNGSLLMLLT
ncbi:hypothetical protein [Desulfosporosinus sp. OT]|uniref:hypothetical protein n=1 Tax=Desulfosporosinus sp. OT TaxID=913865 RepID=UPI001300BFA8|nr:hypothetical protein [Desulfosporosinus sp. OT]